MRQDHDVGKLLAHRINVFRREELVHFTAALPGDHRVLHGRVVVAARRGRRSLAQHAGYDDVTSGFPRHEDRRSGRGGGWAQQVAPEEGLVEALAGPDHTQRRGLGGGGIKP